MVLKNMKYEKKLEDYEKKIKNNLYFTPTKEDWVFIEAGDVNTLKF